ncbi:hypothetical protein ACJQWK_04684 [Exserohilum turcicum]|uniref:Uncharacterized protein n=1 Tax=Exserohilum turcicum (strain 28A) TaxID=671987 RepID=R0K3H6_EXST2|nr:uncharacterized protein SETTUDRAFT_22895 [Exserohilum turcica Et28A]EOA82932.1 hypothetical protein SETTUDRAFT_22895 [Exserohilum turcica Et28A]
MQKSIINDDCSSQHTQLVEQPEHGSWDLVSCILDNFFPRPAKTEMAIVSVLLGLLPMALQLVGPRIVDVAELGLRRPVLAALLSLGSTSAALQNHATGLEAVRRDQKGRHHVLWPQNMIAPPTWAMTLISMVEYVYMQTFWMARAWQSAKRWVEGEVMPCAWKDEILDVDFELVN